MSSTTSIAKGPTFTPYKVERTRLDSMDSADRHRVRKHRSVAVNDQDQMDEPGGGGTVRSRPAVTYGYWGDNEDGEDGGANRSESFSENMYRTGDLVTWRRMETTISWVGATA